MLKTLKNKCLNKVLTVQSLICDFMCKKRWTQLGIISNTLGKSCKAIFIYFCVEDITLG